MNFWNTLEKQPTKAQVRVYLTKKLGQPTTELQQNLLAELVKKVNSYYAEAEEVNYTLHSLVGQVTEISERKYKEGKNKGQTYYVLKLGSQASLQARKELLAEDQWTQVQKMAILGQNLVFKYRKWFANKQVLDFYEQEEKHG